MKECHLCNKSKPFTEFSKCKSRKDGHQTRCKSCIKEIGKIYIDNNKDKLREYRKQYNIDNSDRNKIYYKSNISSFKERFNKKYNENPDIFKQSSIKYYQENREHCINITKINQERINSDPILKEQKRIKTNEYNRKKYSENKYKFILRNQIKNIREKLNTPKNKKLVEELNYTPLDFKIHIESLMLQEMSWDNIGNIEGSWNIDHKIPVTWFKNKTPFYVVNNLENLQPLWREDNLYKSNNYSDNISSDYYNLCKDYILEEKINLIKYDLERFTRKNIQRNK